MRFDSGLHTYGGDMTERERNLIRAMRRNGRSYQEISSSLMIDKDAVRSFCRTHSIEPDADTRHSFCPECGKELTQSKKGRNRRFCSEKCRRSW